MNHDKAILELREKSKKWSKGKFYQLALGFCDKTWTCAWVDTIEGERACKKPPIFPKCPFQIEMSEIKDTTPETCNTIVM